MHIHVMSKSCLSMNDDMVARGSVQRLSDESRYPDFATCPLRSFCISSLRHEAWICLTVHIHDADALRSTDGTRRHRQVSRRDHVAENRDSEESSRSDAVYYVGSERHVGWIPSSECNLNVIRNHRVAPYTIGTRQMGEQYFTRR